MTCYSNSIILLNITMKDALFVELGRRGQASLKKKLGKKKLSAHMKAIGEKGRDALRKKLLA